MEQRKELIGFYLFMRMKTILSNFIRPKNGFLTFTSEESVLPMRHSTLVIALVVGSLCCSGMHMAV